MTVIQYVNIFIALLVLTDPLIALPLVLGIMKNKSVWQRIRVAFQGALASAIILLSMVWIGDPLLNILGIKIYAFQIAGGFVILMLAFSLIQAKLSSIKASEGEENQASGIIVPIAFPIIAGPGAISTVILSAVQFPGAVNHMLLSSICILIAFIAGILLYFSSYLEKVLGQTGLNIFNRLGGLVLMAIAIQIIISGINGAFPKV